MVKTIFHIAFLLFSFQVKAEPVSPNSNVYCAGGWFGRSSDLGLECYLDLVEYQGKHSCYVGDQKQAADLLSNTFFIYPVAGSLVEVHLEKEEIHYRFLSQTKTISMPFILKKCFF